MKIRYSILAVALLMSAANYAQKSELKTLNKLSAKQGLSDKDVATFNSNSTALSAMSGLSAEDQLAADYFATIRPIIKGLSAYQKDPNAVDQFTLTQIVDVTGKLQNIKNNDNTAKKEYAAKVDDMFAQLEAVAHKLTMEAYRAEDLNNAALGFKAMYDMNNSKQEYLYNAAVLSHQNNNLDAAVNLYNALLDSGYTGETTNYLAVNKVSGQEELFDSKANRDKAVTSKVYENPTEEHVPSKKGDIYKNLVNILLYQNKGAQAKTIMADARKLNPTDTDLILAEANLYFQEGDKAKYSSLVQEAIKLKPNDPVLYYNLGVVSAEAKDNENAIKYYKKAIELNPKDYNAYNNIGVVYLSDDVNLVNKMNSLGMSKKEQAEYDALSKKRKENFQKALPFFEKAYELNPNDQLKQLLLNTYRNLDMDAKHKALKNS
ncbi:tetratricopeptide repeat protein [Flavobacterium agricola]|uniref:Tetratricopeptide repeat protein n=1 Tax=Flavobacterium agricola TaxID=2870839 RepID=A0ABY6M130_9FLAO|nr:tetratricopeptide repeat protein [Flavobacterium agricola]UYW02255.1 tetratricopeptide repeat protein [Flavobacterium agricola]